MCCKAGVSLLLLLNSSKIITVRAIEAVMALYLMSRVESMLGSLVTHRVPRKKTNVRAILFFIDICNLQIYQASASVSPAYVPCFIQEVAGIS